jgi:hypothetical protein
MKKIISIALCAVFVCMFIKADAKIRRVGFSGNQIANQDYSDLQAAHDASNAGDTLFIFPGSWSANFSKKMIVVGYGYFLRDSGATVDVQAIDKSFSVSLGLNSGSRENGEDCGMFGGEDSYYLSGIPSILAFYRLTAPTSISDSNPYTITFSVRGNN